MGASGIYSMTVVNAPTLVPGEKTGNSIAVIFSRAGYCRCHGFDPWWYNHYVLDIAMGFISELASGCCSDISYSAGLAVAYFV